MTNKNSLHFITSSDSKFAEAKTVFPDLIRLNLDIDEIQQTSPRTILEHKINAARAIVCHNFFVEDVSLIFDDLKTLPGPLIKWFLRDLGLSGLSELAFKYPSRRAKALCSIAAFWNGNIYFTDAEISGDIVAPRGENGFGWDAIFKPDGSDKTFAELAIAQKQKYSMRAQALLKLKKLIHI